MNWLTGLNEPPADVLDLLEFFQSRVENMDEAFQMIDGGEPGCASNSELTLREFEAGLRAMGCHKFTGPDEQLRIAAVFRYLDPGGEGTVSPKARKKEKGATRQEWSVLDQLWREFVTRLTQKREPYVTSIILLAHVALSRTWPMTHDR